MNKRKTNILRVLNALSPQAAQEATLAMAVKQIEDASKVLNIQPLVEAVNSIESDFTEKSRELSAFVEFRVKDLKRLLDEGQTSSLTTFQTGIESLKGELSSFATVKEMKFFEQRLDKMSKLRDTIDSLHTDLLDIRKENSTIKEETIQNIALLQAELSQLRIDLLSKLQERGGGSMNRQMLIGGVNPLTKYTDINWIAGSNVTVTAVTNDTLKRVDITVTASGGGGSVSSTDLSSQCTGSNKVFTVPANTSFLSLMGTDAPIVYRPTTDYIGSGTTTLTLDAAINAPSSGATLILTYN